ncbi:MAG: PQQ-like beta-propeller repeat protein [Ignavibacteriales bacterium]|nr:PQQ-like beta-propeller repeat protein [Ignavibacteriales bacterium]
MTAKNLLFKNSRPLKHFIFSLSCVVFAVMLTSCEQNPTAPNEPPKPPGYQEDIYWPSLADSPWPMYRADPQNTGRSKSLGPILGNIVLRTDTLWPASGVAVNEVSTIYFVVHSWFEPESGGLLAMNLNGTIKWHYPFLVTEQEPSCSPLVNSDGTIFISSNDPILGQNKFIAINPDGTLKWELNFEGPDENVQTGINIGIDGTLYVLLLTDVLHEYKLTAIDKSGMIKWQLILDGVRGVPGDGMSMSTDGKTLYIPGKIDGKSIYAVDVESQQVKWSFGNKRLYFDGTPLIDSQGNIYIIAEGDSSEGRLYSLSDDGSIRWSFVLDDNFHNAESINPFVMDKLGNLYVGGVTLTSIDFFGEFRWQIDMAEFGAISSPIVIDVNGNIIFTVGSFNETYLLKVNSEGEIILSIPFADLNYNGVNISPAVFYNQYIYPYTPAPTHNPSFIILK